MGSRVLPSGKVSRAAPLCVRRSVRRRGHGWGLSVLDVSEPERPVLVGTTPVADFAHGVTALGDFVYVADGISGVGVHRLIGSNVLEPSGHVETARGYANSVTVHRHFLLVANDAKGVFILDIAEPARPQPAK
jgi:hypothetical protein